MKQKKNQLSRTKLYEVINVDETVTNVDRYEYKGATKYNGDINHYVGEHHGHIISNKPHNRRELF